MQYVCTTPDGLSQQRDRAEGASKCSVLIGEGRPCRKPAGLSSSNSTIGLEVLG
jgi:hypothetical protein